MVLNNSSKKQLNEFYSGIIYTLLSFVIWGALPLYWKLFESVKAFDILIYRIIWSFIFLMITIIVLKNYIFLRLLLNLKSLLSLSLSGMVIGINWFLFIFAVNSDHVVETSLGYYINPLISIFFGMIFLHEKLTRIQWTALILVFISVLYLTLNYGKFPWIALSLSISFATYGLLKKIFKYETLAGLTIETLILFPIAFVFFIISYFKKSSSIISLSPDFHFYLILSGIATVVPLALFAMGTKRIPLSTVGFIQYIAPTLMLLEGIFIYHESFLKTHFISFSLIWCALILYSISLFYKKS
ncbi:MAG: EamA family transporter RarD [Spirochaetes bacterium]|nr:EamA family transporter RarD [Spirochaetota bacterium]